MKNVTISVDDETYRAARVHAAEQGTSISALVKAYLNGLAAEGAIAGKAVPLSGVREMQATFSLAPPAGSPPWLVAGKWVWTQGGKPRQPGALRVAGAPSADPDDAWPADILSSFEAWDEGDFDAIP